MKGYEKLVHAVMRDCADRGSCNCFNENGCNVPNARIESEDGTVKCCSHKYCDKFKWVIERAKHYGEKLGMDWQDVLTEWENNRDYWYMNYYQDAHQPLIKGDHVFVFDTSEDFLASIEAKGFRCPSCGGVSSNPYECDGGCNWKSYGFFRTLGKGVTIVVKQPFAVEEIFKPIAWED